jgi:hypothetical protein
VANLLISHNTSRYMSEYFHDLKEVLQVTQIAAAVFDSDTADSFKLFESCLDVG